MGFTLVCSCGRDLPVEASQAGTSVTCECGAQVTVPSLGKLRELSGQDSYESSTIDTIHRLVRQGELPAGCICALTGEPTQEVLDLYVMVPSAYKPRVFATVLLGYCGFPLGLLIRPFIRMVNPVTASERSVFTPIRLT